MKKDISKITKIEKFVIWDYSKEDDRHRNTKIKSIITKDYKDLTEEEIRFTKISRIIEAMFNKYTDNYSKSLPIFRGIKVEKSIFDDYYQQYKIASGQNMGIIIDKSIMSSSKDLYQAERFAKLRDSKEYSILYVIKSRISDSLEIENYSKYPEEQEIILNKGLSFKILN